MADISAAPSDSTTKPPITAKLIQKKRNAANASAVDISAITPTS